MCVLWFHLNLPTYIETKMFDTLQHLSMADKIMGDFYLFTLSFQHFSLYENKFPL